MTRRVATRRRYRRQRRRRSLPGVRRAADLESVLFLGYLPPVNQMRTVGQRPHEQPAYPGGAAALPALPARAARAHRRSGDPVSARVSVHERHDEDSARELRRAPARGDAAPRPARHRAGRRHRVERRHAARELPEAAGHPRLRHRADADGEPRERARHPHDHELLRRRIGRAGRQRSAGKAHGRDRHERVRAHRGRPRHRRQRPGDARATTASSSRNRTT